MSKFSFGGSSIYNQGAGKRLETTIFYYGTVVSNNDELGANRIIVRIIGIDDTTALNELPYAFPMVQKFFHVVPKVGESVLVFIPNVINPYIDRLYIGPIISQPQMLKNDSELYSSKSTLDSGNINSRPSPNTIPENRGVYPKTQDIAMQGRDNSDLIFREKEVIIRAGQFNVNTLDGDIPKFNKVNPSYIQIKHDVVIKAGSETISEERGGVINIVSNKINILSHKNGSPRFELNNQDSNISDEELLKIINEAHPLVFGDVLIEYIKVLRSAFLNHVHSYPGKKPQDLSGGNDIDNLLEFDLNSLLSKNIKIK
jgi:hypothetical protein